MSEPGLPGETPLGFDPDAAITPYVEQELQYFAARSDTSEVMGKIHVLAAWAGTGRAGREARVLVDALRRWLVAALDRLLSAPLDKPKSGQASWLDFIDGLSQQASRASSHSQAASELTLSELAGPFLGILTKCPASERLMNLFGDFITIAQGARRAERVRLFTSLQRELRDVAKRLVLCGDYDLQNSLLEVLELMMPTELDARSVAVGDIFPQHLYKEEARRIFVDYDFDQMERDGRKFLRQVNRDSGRVVDILCDSLIQNGEPLLAPDRTYDGKRYVYLSKGSSSITLEYAGADSQYETFTLRSNDLENVRMSRGDDGRDDRRVFIELNELRNTPDSLSNTNTIFRCYPCRNIVEAHLNLKQVFLNKYKCKIKIDATLEDAEQVASPTDSLRPNDEKNNSTAADDSIGEFEEWRRRSRRRSTSSRPTTPSSVASTPLREKLEKEPLEPFYDRQFPRPIHASKLYVIPENSRSSTHSLATLVPSELNEEPDTDLVDDLYEAALSGHEITGSKKTGDVVENNVNINSEKKHVLNGNGSNISICTKRPSLKKTVLTKSKEPISSKYPLLIENEVFNRNKETNLKNISENEEKEISVKIKHPQNITKSNNRNPTVEIVKITKGPPKKKMCDLSEKLDIVNQNKEPGKDAAIDSNNSDTIPDTPNIEDEVQFDKISFRKANKNLMKQSAKQDAKPEKVTSKEAKKRNENKTTKKRTNRRVISETDTDVSCDNQIEDRDLYELNANCGKTPAQLRKKRKLYSPQGDFIMQNSQEETNEVMTTKFFSSPKGEPYVLLSKLELNPKRVQLQPVQMIKKLSADELFDQVKSSHAAYPTVDITATKDVDGYNLPSNSDSGEDFKKVNTRRKRKSSPIDYSPKLKKKMTKQKCPTKCNKKQLNKKISVRKADVLQDEKMRSEQHLKDLINVSLDIEPEMEDHAEEEVILPTGLDHIEIQSIPPHNDQPKLIGDNQTLNDIKDGQNEDETTVTSADQKSVNKLRGKMNKKLNKDVVSKPTNKGKKKSKPGKYSQGEEELLPPLIVEVHNVQSKKKKGFNDFQVEMQNYLLNKNSKVLTHNDNEIMEDAVSNPRNENDFRVDLQNYLLKNTSKVLTRNDNQIMEDTVSNSGNDSLPRQLEPTFKHEYTIFPISVPNSPEISPQEELATTVQDVIDEVSDTSVNNLNATNESSQEAPKCKDSCYRSISTNGNSPITARYNCDDVPPNVLSIDLEEPARDIDTEHLSLSDQNCINKLRRQVSSPKKQDDASCTSDSDAPMLCCYKGHLSPVKSVNNIAAMKSVIMRGLKKSSNLNETQQISQSPPIPKQPEKRRRRGCAQSPEVEGGGHVENAASGDDNPFASEKLKELGELFMEFLETGVREPSHTLTTRLTTVFAKFLRKVSDWSVSCKEDDEQCSQEQEREFELLRRRHLQLQRDMRKQQKQELQHVLEEVKSGMVHMLHDYNAQTDLRLSMLREDITRMLHANAQQHQRLHGMSADGAHY